MLEAFCSTRRSCKKLSSGNFSLIQFICVFLNFKACLYTHQDVWGLFLESLIYIDTFCFPVFLHYGKISWLVGNVTAEDREIFIMVLNDPGQKKNGVPTASGH